MEIFIGIMIPFIGTTLGAAMVFLLKNSINTKIEKLLLGIASGVMIAASIWSLIIPSIEFSGSYGIFDWLPAAIGFIAGIFSLIMFDLKTERTKLDSNFKLFSAVTIHNIPEGMAVGVAFAGALSGQSDMTMIGAMILATGIAIQNFPEGSIISMPLKAKGFSKTKSFLYGMFSGIVEPISSFITILLISQITVLLPYLLAFAAGAMIYVVIDELIPQFKSGDFSKIGIIGVTIGFLIMMILDVVFS